MRSNGANIICFLSSFFTPSPPPSHHGSVLILLIISLLLTNTCTIPDASLPNHRMEEVSWDQKEDDHGPLSIQSSLVRRLGVAVLDPL
jgi:hypothetical protein